MLATQYDDLDGLTAQWQAHDQNKALIEESGFQGALQPHTVETLYIAETYCFHQEAIENIWAASESMPEDASLTSAMLGSLPRAGWWWFTVPLPVVTCADEQPVVALLWERYPSGLWINAFVEAGMTTWAGTDLLQRVYTHGRYRNGVILCPTAAWTFPTGVSMADMPAGMRKGYETTNMKEGVDALGMDGTVTASLMLSKFVAAAIVWMQQRVVLTEPATVGRQIGRQLQREHKLAKRPAIRVVKLRRKATESNEHHASEKETRREYSCRWVVNGHWRKQPYGPRDNPKYRAVWIDGYVKGPEEMPFKETKRLFSVKR
tara:strand:+ start:6225 stop:7181 length:957 start_codon:yes stop_codon:yes gene_type:complete